MKRIHLMTAILLIIALALPFGTYFVSAQEGSDGTPLSSISAQEESVNPVLPSVSAEEESDGILFWFSGGGITREPSTETLVQVYILHTSEVNDELFLKKVEVYGEDEIPVKTFDFNKTLESVADSYDQLKSLSEKLGSAPDEAIGTQAAALSQEIRSKSFSTEYFNLDLHDLRQPLTLGDRIPITAKATFIHHGEPLVIERSLLVEYQPGLTNSPPEGQTTSSVLELQDWKPGVQHVHTKYSWYDASYPPGGGPTVYDQAQAAKNAGLSWIIITDHEVMLAWPDPDAWDKAKLDCQQAQTITGIKVMLGEELGNVFPSWWAGHYLAYGINSFVESDRTNQGMIDAVNNEGGFGYIAHPYTNPLDPYDNWDDWNVTGYTGLEIMNGPTASADAINKWTEILEDPSARIFGIGNSDAHWPGEIANAYVYCDIETVTHSSVYSALENGHSVVTNGPLVAFTIDDNPIGDVVNARGQTMLDIAWDSSQEFGEIQEIEVYTNEGNVEDITDVGGTAGSTSVMVDVTLETLYIRLRGIFSDGYEAYTNPIWVNYTREDFEWGSDGASLATDGGDVDWTVTISGGSSRAEIETDPNHVLSGMGSARIYRANYYNVYASYPEFRPRCISFCLKKDGTSYANIMNGDGEHRIFVRINSSEQLQYYDDWGYHSTGWSVSVNTWYTIALENIDWDAATYDIRVVGHFFESGVRMHTTEVNNGYVYYASLSGSGNFWIDNISSWVNYSTLDDFEWGSDGESLATDGGDVDWTVLSYGTSRAEIETDPDHVLSGMGSARIYRANFYNVYAYYPEFRPQHIKCCLKKDGTSYAYILNGDGAHRIFVRIDNSGQLQYYDDLGYHNTGWSVPDINSWYTIVLENVDWGAATYDICVSGHFFKHDVAMNTGPSNNGYVYYASLSGSGNFWIDDISS
jgi:hypothetical protein